MLIRVHRLIPLTMVEGPGKRACLWVQGCSIHCSGCAVPETWPANGGYEMEVEDVVDRILEGPQVEGITFVGGEPFDQAEALAYLSGILRQNGLSVVTFTGYTLEDILKSSRKEWYDLLEATDLLIDSPYIDQLFDLSRPWVGSSNQRYHFLTTRYREFDLCLNKIENKMELRIDPNGKVMLNGMADVKKIKRFINGLIDHL